MSERIPVIVTGDRVRVMQTREAETEGLANRRGTVVGGIIRWPGETISFVVLDGDRETTHIPDSWLMILPKRKESGI